MFAIVYCDAALSENFAWLASTVYVVLFDPVMVNVVPLIDATAPLTPYLLMCGVSVFVVSFLTSGFLIACITVL